MQALLRDRTPVHEFEWPTPSKELNIHCPLYSKSKEYSHTEWKLHNIIERMLSACDMYTHVCICMFCRFYAGCDPLSLLKVWATIVIKKQKVKDLQFMLTMFSLSHRLASLKWDGETKLPTLP